MEIWKPVLGYENYEVSNKGRVKSLQRTKIRSNGRPHTTPERFLSACKDTKGYLQVYPYDVDGKRNYVAVHKAVYESFNGLVPDGWEVDHKDSDQLNNCVGNLQCLTKSHHQRISRQRRVDAGFWAGVEWYKQHLKGT